MTEKTNAPEVTELGDEKVTFAELGLSIKTLEWLDKKGFKHPSPIQEEVIPLLLANKKNIIGQAATGTGKTAAFGIPMIERFDHRTDGQIQALVLVPTRELAIQVAEEISSLQTKRNLDVVAIYGGQSYEIQNRALKKWVDIVVGTPGRIMDHLDRRTLKLQNISYFILDEADEMLNMGFIDDIETIFKQTNPEKRVLLFSATMPKAILSVAKKYMGDYQLVEVKHNQMTTIQTEQFFIQISERDKMEALCRIMDKEEDFYGIVFCKTKMDVDNVFSRLHEKWYSVQALHGDVQQKQRENILKLFKAKKTKILVATDVAARGIDVNDITHVINFSIPQDPESYVHRIGRTGRAGKTGIAITFITPSELRKFTFFQKVTNASVTRMDVPAVSHVIDAKKKKLKESIDSMLEKGAHQKYIAIAQDLLLDKDPEHVLAAMLKIAYNNEFDADNYNHINKVEASPDRGFDRGDRGDRWPRGNGWARLFIALGKKAGYHNKALVDYLVEETGMQSREIDDVRVMEDFAFVTVPEAQVAHVLQTLKGISSRAKEDGNRSGGRSSGGFNRWGDRGGRPSGGSNYGRRDDKPRSFSGERKPFSNDRPKSFTSNDRPQSNTWYVKKAPTNRFRDREAR